MPIPTLVEQGVKISVAHDSLTDHWSPFGSGNTIEKLNTAAQRFKISDEYRLNRLWGLASNFVTPLDLTGSEFGLTSAILQISYYLMLRALLT